MSERLRVLLEAAVHCGTPGDVRFYIDMCAGARHVLELGCGAGRVGGEIAASGCEVTGVDLDAGALEVAAGRGVNVVHADMRELGLDRRFDRIVVPFGGLYCLLEDDDVVACLEAARAHLAPAGRLLLDVYCAEVFHADAPEPGEGEVDEEALVASVVVDGRAWAVHERSAWWRPTQRIDAWYRYAPADGGEDGFERCVRQRYLLHDQLVALVGRAGLAVLGLDGGFDAEPWRPDSELMVLAAARP